MTFRFERSGGPPRVSPILTMGSGKHLRRMTILSYRQGAERIAWHRERKLDALRDEVLTAIYRKLSHLEPNTALNIRHPWKLSQRHSIAGWCPLHNGRWVKLIIRAAEDVHVTFECAAGCSEQQVRDRIVDVADDSSRTAVQIAMSLPADSAMGAGGHRQSRRGVETRVIDARHRFQCRRKTGGGLLSSGGHGDAA